MKRLNDKVNKKSPYYCLILKWMAHILRSFNFNDNPKGIYHYQCFIHYDVSETQELVEDKWLIKHRTTVTTGLSTK